MKINFVNSKKIIHYTLRHNFCSYLPAQKNIIECSRGSNCSRNYHLRHGNRFSSFPFSKSVPHPILYNRPMSISQCRKISNDAADVKNNALISDLTLPEESVNLSQFAVPNIVKYVSEWKIVELSQQILLNVHDITGLPWWASISLTAFTARTVVTLPLTLSQIRTATKLEMVHTELKDTAKRLQQEANYLSKRGGWPESLVKSNFKKKFQKEYNELIISNNCHPAKCYILVLIQVPMWISFSFALRNLCHMLPKQDINAQITFMELTAGGFGWITNLVATDQYILLPIILGLLNLIVLEVHQLFRTSPQIKFEKWIRIFFRTLIIASIPIATQLPAALNIYWISSSSYGLLQAFLINSTRLRRLFRIPVSKYEQKHPYQYFYNNFKSKLLNK